VGGLGQRAHEGGGGRDGEGAGSALEESATAGRRLEFVRHGNLVAFRFGEESGTKVFS
jgi:hypothetical protein